jgi:hypothetical protein
VPVVVPVGAASRTARGGGAAGVGVDLDVAAVPPPAEAPSPVEPFAPAVEGMPAPGEVVAAPPPAPWPPPAPSAAGRLSALTLPPPPPLAPAGRGFFEGDWVRLELLVVDARTGAVRRAKVLTEDMDVRDALKIGQLIDGALASANGWAVSSGDRRNTSAMMSAPCAEGSRCGSELTTPTD